MVCPFGASSMLGILVPATLMLARDGRLRFLWNGLLLGNPLGWLVYYWLGGGFFFRISLEIFFVLTLLLCASRVAWLHWVEARPLPVHARLAGVSAALSQVLKNRIVLLLKGLLLGLLVVNMLGTVSLWPAILTAGGILLVWVCMLLFWRRSLVVY